MPTTSGVSRGRPFRKGADIRVGRAGILGPAMTSRPTYRDACRAFRWEESARALGWATGEPVNLGRTIVDRHAGGGRPALRWLGKRGEDRTYSFEELSELTGRFASLLRA